MFKFEFYAEDKNVPAILRQLSGSTYGLSVVPIFNVKLGKGGVLQEIAPPSVPVQLVAWLREGTKWMRFRKSDVQEFLKSIGRSPGSAGSLIMGLKKQGVIISSGKGRGMVWRVVRTR